MPAIICATLSGPALAETINCDLDGTSVQFAIDKAQFAPAIDTAEPPRRRVTTVQMGDANFPAEPILIGDVRGFFAEGMGGSEIMMAMQSDGSAIFADPRAGIRLTGTCEVTQ